ncbi:hypothetical protein [Tardiphaga sp.]|jgi:hypothetical protein|uniref:hypothetical protein n=1 Tax=Tardiphaga sp. TaxID=1926292 RepID=UPI0037D9EE53
MDETAEKAARDLAIMRQMTNFTLANSLAMRVLVTEQMAGHALSDDEVAAILDALMVAGQDPDGSFRNAVLGIIDDIRTTSALLKSSRTSRPSAPRKK